MHDREIGVARAEALDRFGRLELEDLDHHVWMCAAHVTHSRWHERRQGAWEGGEPQASRPAAQVLDRCFGAAELGEDPLYVRAQGLPGARGCQRPPRPVDERFADLPLERGELLRDPDWV